MRSTHICLLSFLPHPPIASAILISAIPAHCTHLYPLCYSLAFRVIVFALSSAIVPLILSNKSPPPLHLLFPFCVIFIIQILEGDVTNFASVIKDADVVIMNNVFEFFSPAEQQRRQDFPYSETYHPLCD